MGVGSFLMAAPLPPSQLENRSYATDRDDGRLLSTYLKLGGSGGDFQLISFHAKPIGLMLNFTKVGGGSYPSAYPVLVGTYTL